MIDEAHAKAGGSAVADTPLRYEFNSAAELLAICRQHSLRISEVMLANEGAWRSEDETRVALQRIWEAMRACVARGIRQGGVLPAGLNVRRRAPALHVKLARPRHSYHARHRPRHAEQYEETSRGGLAVNFTQC